MDIGVVGVDMVEAGVVGTDVVGADAVGIAVVGADAGDGNLVAFGPLEVGAFELCLVAVGPVNVGQAGLSLAFFERAADIWTLAMHTTTRVETQLATIAMNDVPTISSNISKESCGGSLQHAMRRPKMRPVRRDAAEDISKLSQCLLAIFSSAEGELRLERKLSLVSMNEAMEGDFEE